MLSSKYCMRFSAGLAKHNIAGYASSLRSAIWYVWELLAVYIFIGVIGISINDWFLLWRHVAQISYFRIFFLKQNFSLNFQAMYYIFIIECTNNLFNLKTFLSFPVRVLETIFCHRTPTITLRLLSLGGVSASWAPELLNKTLVSAREKTPRA